MHLLKISGSMRYLIVVFFIIIILSCSGTDIKVKYLDEGVRKHNEARGQKIISYIRTGEKEINNKERCIYVLAKIKAPSGEIIEQKDTIYFHSTLDGNWYYSEFKK